MQQQQKLAYIRQKAAIVSARVRLSDALRWFVLTLPVPLLTSIVCLAIIKLRGLDWGHSRSLVITVAIACLLPVITSAYQLVRRRGKWLGSIALDNYHGLSDRLTNALYFSSLPREQQTNLMKLAIVDGCTHANNLNARKSSPISLPRGWALPLVLTLMLALLATFEIRTVHHVAQAQTIDAVTLATDDLDYLRDNLKEIQKDNQDPSLGASLTKFNQLVEDIANRRLDRTEAFRRMEALERELRAGLEADKKSMEESLKRVASELRSSQVTKQTADSLSATKLDEAEKQLRKIAKELRERKLDKHREQLKKALENASKSNAKRLEQLQQQREQLLQQQKRLLKQKNLPGSAAEQQQQRLLKQNKRQLEQLDRQIQQQQNTNRQLSRLDRDLAQAAADLAKDLGLSADNLNQAAEELSNLNREQMTDQQKERLRQQLEQMRQLMRQQGQGGKARMARLVRFSKRAKGQQQNEGKQGQGKPCQGQSGQGQQGNQGQQDQQGQGNQGGQGKGQEVWEIGPDGKPILIMKSAQLSSSQSGTPSDNPSSPSSAQWGVGHDPKITGASTKPKMSTQDVTAQGIDTGQGPSRAEVIQGAAERGFVGKNYEKVFGEYHTVAEQAIDKEQVPAGYRFYVQRYFQLIRPRE